MGRGVLEGAFRLLEEIIDTRECGLSELAARTGLPKTTAHRLLEQLIQLRAVERRGGRYRVGATAFRLGSWWHPAEVLRAAGHQPLRQLARALPGASLALIVPDGEHTLLVSVLDGEVNEVLPLRAGIRFRAHDEWPRLVRSAHAGDGVIADEVLPGSVGAAGVSAAVRARSGEVVGAVAAAVLDRRRVPAMVSAVGHAARLTSGRLAHIRHQR